MSEHLNARLNALRYRRPSPEVQATMTVLREAFQVLCGSLDGCIPECREKSLAFTALEESALWAMQALSLTDPGAVVIDPPPMARAKE
jgi:hypothetical protein